MTEDKILRLEERITNIEIFLERGALDLGKLEDEYSDSEAFQFSRERVQEIMEYADSKGYVYESAGRGALIFDRDHAEDVRRYAANNAIGFRLLKIVDPLVNPVEAASIVDRIRNKSKP